MKIKIFHINKLEILKDLLESLQIKKASSRIKISILMETHHRMKIGLLKVIIAIIKQDLSQGTLTINLLIS